MFIERANYYLKYICTYFTCGNFYMLFIEIFVKFLFSEVAEEYNFFMYLVNDSLKICLQLLNRISGYNSCSKFYLL